MARLHKYAQSSDKSGYHLRGRSPKSNTTFQVGRAATLLIDWLDISIGDRIPDDLLWEMYDAELVWTGSRGQTAQQDRDLATFLEESAGQHSLTDGQTKKLQQFIHEYDDQDQAAVTRLSSLVSDVEYEESDEYVTGFAAQNDLYEIAERYFSSDAIDEDIELILDNYEASRSTNEFVLDLPDRVRRMIPEMEGGFFELADIAVSKSGITYSLEDPEMWIGEGMVWTDWRLFDNRGSQRPSEDFEAEFEIETDAYHVGSPVIGYAVIDSGEITYMQLIPDFESEDTETLAGSDLVTEPYGAFREYLYDCLDRQFSTVSSYDYSGPEAPFSR